MRYSRVPWQACSGCFVVVGVLEFVAGPCLFFPKPTSASSLHTKHGQPSNNVLQHARHCIVSHRSSCTRRHTSAHFSAPLLIVRYRSPPRRTQQCALLVNRRSVRRRRPTYCASRCSTRRTTEGISPCRCAAGCRDTASRAQQCSHSESLTARVHPDFAVARPEFRCYLNFPSNWRGHWPVLTAQHGRCKLRRLGVTTPRAPSTGRPEAPMQLECGPRRGRPGQRTRPDRPSQESPLACQRQVGGPGGARDPNRPAEAALSASRV